MFAQKAPSNAQEWSVSDLAGALKRTLEDAFGHVRLRGEVSGYRGPHSSGHAYFCLKDQNARIDAVIWKGSFAKLKIRPEEGMEVIATGRITTFPGSSKYQIVVETLEPAGIGALMALLEERRRKLQAEGLFAAERKRRAAVPAAGDRRRHLADGRGDPRHPPSPRGPLPAPGAGLARARAGRNQRGGGRRRHPRLQRAGARRPDSAARRAHRRPRRRVHRGPLGLQRGDRGARRGRERDPARLGGGPRDRHHAHRLRRRHARPDADGRRRDGGAGAGRAHGGRSTTSRAAMWRLPFASWSGAVRTCAPRPARCRAPTP